MTYFLKCPTCGAEPGNHCVTKNGNYARQHVTRQRRQYKARKVRCNKDGSVQR